MSEQPKRVLFICIGNSCRSQMAEAFARAYGSDVMVPASAGLMPASIVAPDTMRAMAEKGLSLRDHFPKSVRHLSRVQFDLAINISGHAVPEKVAPVIREWNVADPVALDFDQHCDVRDEIEKLVMDLVIELRREQRTPPQRAISS